MLYCEIWKLEGCSSPDPLRLTELALSIVAPAWTARAKDPPRSPGASGTGTGISTEHTGRTPRDDPR